MASTRELIDDLEKRKALFDIAVKGTDLDEGGMNPLVADAIASAPPAQTGVAPSSEPGKVDVTLGGAFGGATIPFTPGTAAPSSASPKPVIPAPQVDAQGNSFYDMLLANDAYRQQNAESFERNERANKARTTLAAVTDALASLGNLVGTTQGAFSQPQTYQTPFVTEQVEADRARARALADRIQANDQTLRLAQAREEMTSGAYALKQALEEEKTRRAMENNAARAALAAQNAGYRSDLEGVKHGYRTDEETQKQAGRETIQTMRNQQSDINNRRSTGTSAANNIRTNDRIRETGGGGSVGGYTTTTQSEYDELGHKVRETKTRTGANGQTTTTTTTPGGRKPNPMGSAPQQGGKKKKKNPMN